MDKLLLSRLERQLLINQVQILEKIEQDEDLKELYKQKREILVKGFEGEYEKLFDVRTDSEVIPLAVCNETKNILNMFVSLDNAIKRINNEGTPYYNKSLVFSGFDPYDNHFEYATHLINSIEIYDIFRGKAMEERSGTALTKYRRMITKYEEINPDGLKSLNIDELNEISEAAR